MAKTVILRLGVPNMVRLPADPARVQQLREKLREYERRRSDEARYKALVLGKVLADAEVPTADLAAHVEAEVGAAFNRSLFNDCCNIIDDYCRTGGLRTMLGSGLAGPG